MILVAVEIFETRIVRGSSYIPTPAKYSNAKCALINIRILIRNASNCACDIISQIKRKMGKT